MSCNSCNKGCNPCNYHKKNNDCEEFFDLGWVPNTGCTMALTINGQTKTLPLKEGIENCETITHMSQNSETGCIEFFNELYLSSEGERGAIESICPQDIAKFINLDDLADVNAPDPNNCDLLVFNPGCNGNQCEDPCADDFQWRNYTIPRADDTGCVMEPDADGFHKVLTLDECGCIQECKLTVAGPVVADYHRDSVPDDPDWPWYYGCYNETIDLHLEQNSPYFNKTPLKVTIIYGIQAIKPRAMANYNFRSLLVPTIKGENVPVTTDASILQDDCSAVHGSSLVDGPYHDKDRIPWASKSMRGMITFLVPKGKGITLHHEFRIRTAESEVPGGPGYAFNAEYDGKRVPDNLVGAVDLMPYGGSRLNALQVITEPAMITKHLTPALDPAKNKLDAPVDVYPPLIIG